MRAYEYMSCSKAYLSFLVEYEEALRENQSAQSMPDILLKDLPKSFHVVLLEGGRLPLDAPASTRAVLHDVIKDCPIRTISYSPPLAPAQPEAADS